MDNKRVRTPLLADPEAPANYGTKSDNGGFKLMKDRAWSFQDARRATATASKKGTSEDESPVRKSPTNDKNKAEKKGPEHYLYCVVYAIVNVIISAPGLYGYAAVIFNNPVFENHMNALSKLVIFSSLIHQLGFFLFSSLDFAIGTVQDAGLIFLSAMANTIANRMLEDGHTEKEIVSTTLVLLSLGTAALGLVLMIMGRFRLADAVSYLPMPVVGGYLAFIGYFCCQAGVALCISKPLMTLGDWMYVVEPRNFMLALPGLATGLVLTFTSRLATNPGALPILMVSIPALFYLLLYLTGTSLDDVREDGWVGPVAPSVPVGDLFTLVEFSLVRWDLVGEIITTWVGMVFVVSFASCLDVAAISIDMGEPLETNRELATVGMCNLMSGLTFGFTGSYIFSQTIFTYRTGVHSRLIGVLIMIVFLYIVVSPVNVLEISPLFFLGSTLIFIGYDLMYEWLWEVRDQVFLSEYAIVWLTFFAIQIVGIDAGIVIGVLIAIVEQIVKTAQTSNVIRVEKRSRAVWTPSDAKILHHHAYSAEGPKIVTLEVVGTIFFGSALNILNRITEEIGLVQDEEALQSPAMTPHTSSSILTLDRKASFAAPKLKKAYVRPPKYLVLDLMGVSNLDASASRGCFLQLVKMCAKRDILICASGATPRIEWMFRSHGVSVSDLEEEAAHKAKLLSREPNKEDAPENILLFLTVQEALEFCESSVVHRLNMPNQSQSLSQVSYPVERSLSNVLSYVLGASNEERSILARLEDQRYHDEVDVKSGEHVFRKNTYPEAFYVVLQGCVANSTSSAHAIERQKEPVLSGAGLVKQERAGSSSDLFHQGFLDQQNQCPDKGVTSLWQVGGVFGYLDYLLERPRRFRTLATQDGTKVARFTHSHMNLLQAEDPPLHSMIQRVLLQASNRDLANCTCHDV